MDSSEDDDDDNTNQYASSSSSSDNDDDDNNNTGNDHSYDSNDDDEIVTIPQSAHLGSSYTSSSSSASASASASYTIIENYEHLYHFTEQNRTILRDLTSVFKVSKSTLPGQSQPPLSSSHRSRNLLLDEVDRSPRCWPLKLILWFDYPQTSSSSSSSSSSTSSSTTTSELNLAPSLLLPLLHLTRLKPHTTPTSLLTYILSTKNTTKQYFAYLLTSTIPPHHTLQPTFQPSLYPTVNIQNKIKRDVSRMEYLALTCFSCSVNDNVLWSHVCEGLDTLVREGFVFRGDEDGIGLTGKAFAFFSAHSPFLMTGNRNVVLSSPSSLPSSSVAVEIDLSKYHDHFDLIEYNNLHPLHILNLPPSTTATTATTTTAHQHRHQRAMSMSLSSESELNTLVNKFNLGLHIEMTVMKPAFCNRTRCANFGVPDILGEEDRARVVVNSAKVKTNDGDGWEFVANERFDWSLIGLNKDEEEEVEVVDVDDDFDEHENNDNYDGDCDLSDVMEEVDDDEMHQPPPQFKRKRSEEDGSDSCGSGDENSDDEEDEEEDELSYCGSSSSASDFCNNDEEDDDDDSDDENNQVGEDEVEKSWMVAKVDFKMKDDGDANEDSEDDDGEE